MRKNSYFLVLIVALAIGFSSCKKESTEDILIGFEETNVTLSSGYYNGSDKSGKEVKITSYGKEVTAYQKEIKEKVGDFHNQFTPNKYGGSWSGFAISTLNDTTNGTYTNQYSVYGKSGATNSKHFAVAFDSAYFAINSDIPTTIKSVRVTNSTYTLKTIRDGNNFSTKFVKGAWFKATFKGYKNSNITGKVEVYLADFRKENQQDIIADWTSIDLTPLLDATSFSITFDGSDKGDYGLNTPKYICLDNFVFEQTTID